MCRMDVEKEFERLFSENKKTLSVLSRSDKEKPETALVQNKELAYDFDEITDIVWDCDDFSSADALCVNQKRIYLIEFKTGFSSVDAEIVDSQLVCYKLPKPMVCEDYKECLKQRNDYKKKSLYYSIKLKVIESYRTLICKIFSDKMPRNDYTLNFLCVIDGKNIALEKYGNDINELTKKSSEGDSENYVTRLKKSIKKYRDGHYGYDSIDVWTAGDFQKNFTIG